ncbi:RipA family octameric membrane protein [Granulicella paludicola]
MAFEAWKFQVETYWTRSSYFVVFELAAAAGVWQVFAAGYRLSACFACLASLYMTRIWQLNNQRLSEYIHFYWYRLQDIEKTAGHPMSHRIFSRWENERPQRKYSGDYRSYVNKVPLVFFAAWTWGISVFIYVMSEGSTR